MAKKAAAKDVNVSQVTRDAWQQHWDERERDFTKSGVEIGAFVAEQYGIPAPASAVISSARKKVLESKGVTEAGSGGNGRGRKATREVGAALTPLAAIEVVRRTKEAVDKLGGAQKVANQLEAIRPILDQFGGDIETALKTVNQLQDL